MAESRRIPSEAENPSGLRLGAAAPPPRGPIPDRFQIKEVVRSGAAVQTYKAYDRANRTWVLAKVVSGIQSGSTLLSQWRLHNDVVECLGHPAFVPAIEMGHSGDSIWLIMPFIAGKTLRQRLRSGRHIPSREAAALVAELAEALQLAPRLWSGARQSQTGTHPTRERWSNPLDRFRRAAATHHEFKARFACGHARLHGA